MGLRSRPSRAAIAVALGAVLLVASCGAVGQNARGAADDTSRVRVLNPYGGDLPAEGTPRPGGNLIIGNDREIVSFDPTRQNGNVAAQAVYDLLLRIGPDGQLRPWMAQSIDSPDNGLTWRLGLRPGVRFSDGTDLNADAVIINVQRHMDKATSPAHVYADRIASMRAVDPLTVEFTLTAPLGDFPVYFAQSFNAGSLGMIVSPAALAQYGDDIANHPVGAGPFVLQDWIRDNRMVLDR